jgi:hypothetical protein
MIVLGLLLLLLSNTEGSNIGKSSKLLTVTFLILSLHQILINMLDDFFGHLVLELGLENLTDRSGGI